MEKMEVSSKQNNNKNYNNCIKFTRYYVQYTRRFIGLRNCPSKCIASLGSMGFVSGFATYIRTLHSTYEIK